MCISPVSSLEVISLDFMEATIEVLKLQYLTDEELPIAMGNFSVSNVDHVVVDIEVQLKRNNKGID